AAVSFLPLTDFS
ncbi:hypothetical protein A2U01_0071118, partial [Trifolium medium]|nr:hypothetical protein [Trifolium medium]